MRPLIGLTTYRRALTTSIGQRTHFTLYTTYCEAILAADGVPVMLPPTESFSLDEVLTPLSGVLLAGGGDIGPDLYGEPPDPTVDRVDPVRDRFEVEIVKWTLRHDLPILGICRGMQLLNVACGGTLIQDIASQTGSLLRHTRPDAIDDPVHFVRIEPASRLARVLGGTELSVNTGHHQAVGRIAPGLHVVGWAEDGTVEAIESESQTWIVGVQWHPEMMFQRYAQQLRLFAGLVEAGLAKKEASEDGSPNT